MKTNIRSGVTVNHNQTLVSKRGRIISNHNQTVVRAGITVNHNQTLVRKAS